jgi:hypothetical protein
MEDEELADKPRGRGDRRHYADRRRKAARVEADRRIDRMLLRWPPNARWMTKKFVAKQTQRIERETLRNEGKARYRIYKCGSHMCEYCVRNKMHSRNVLSAAMDEERDVMQKYGVEPWPEDAEGWEWDVRAVAV